MVALIKQETVTDYALRTGLSERTVYKHIKEGKLTAEKVKPHGSGNHYWLIQTRIEVNDLYPLAEALGYNTERSIDVWGEGGKSEQ
jgi:hypothetical protein